MVFFIPDRANIYTDEWLATKRLYGLSDKDWSIDRPRMELAEVCKRNSIDFLDATQLLRIEAEKLAPAHKRLYNRQDMHWNSLGNEFVGKILASYIRAHYLQ